MDDHGLSPSPVARLLLDLAVRSAEGKVDVGGRAVAVRQARVVAVDPGPGDQDLGEFLRSAGRIGPDDLAIARADARASGATMEEVLLRLGKLTKRTMADTRRALWLDRLVKGIAETERSENSTPLFEPGSAPGPDVPGVPMVPFVLDAWARRADEGDAGHVGSRAGHLLLLAEGPLRAEAVAWLDAGDLAGPTRVAHLLSRAPAAATRIAALLRAGVGTMHAAPDPSPPDVHPDESDEGAACTAEPGGEVRGRRGPDRSPTSLLPPRPALRRVDPGHATEATAPGDLTSRPTRLPAFVAPLDDDLDALERRVRELELAGAAGPERARAWCDFARFWQSSLQSLDEASRAYREAVAADPTDVMALKQCAILCAATGELDVAGAYARSLVRVSQGEDRIRALLSLAGLELRRGRVEDCLSAIEEAAEVPGGEGAAQEMACDVLASVARIPEAIPHAVAAASALRAIRPDRARAVLAWAHHQVPDNPELLLQYSEALSADGYADGAIAVLADAAERVGDPDVRRGLRLDAAQRAELAGRHDVASELLLRAFETEPHVDFFYEPLATDLAAAGRPLRRAVLLEAFSRCCPAESRAFWLTRAADAFLERPSGVDHAMELFTRALVQDPGAPRALEALQDQAAATGDRTRLADALERAARLCAGSHAAAADDLLAMLARLAEEQLGSPPRALWAVQRRLTLHPGDAALEGRRSTLQERVRLKQDVLSMAERDLQDAEATRDAGKSAGAARKLASMLRDDPAQRERAIALYRRALGADPDDETAAASLECLYTVMGDSRGLSDLLAERAERATSRSAKIRLFRRLAALHSLRGEDRQSARAALALLQSAPGDREALARLERAAHRLGDGGLAAEALRRGSEAGADARERARCFMRLAHHFEAGGEPDQAVSCAAEALHVHARCTEAAVMLGRHPDAQPPAARLGTLRLLRRALGDSVPLLAAIADAAAELEDEDTEADAVDAWASLAPLDPVPATRRLSSASDCDDAKRLHEAIEQAVSAPDVDTPLVARALDRLGQLAGATEAASVALHAVDRVGHRDPAVLQLALTLSRQSSRSAHHIAALERLVASRHGDTRVPPLIELAEIHRAAGRRAAEARTLLRVLAVRPHHAGALERLTSVYAESGETERLMAVVSLRLEAATTAEERRERLLDMAAAALRVDGDRTRAEGFARDLVDENAGDPDAAAVAAGVLAKMGRVEAGVAVLVSASETARPELAAKLCDRAVALAEGEGHDPALALATAVRGLERFPAHAPLLLVFERLALARGDVATARATYGMLAGRALGAHGRRALLYRLARWLEDAGDPVAALDAYCEAFDLSPTAGVVFTAIQRLGMELATFLPVAEAYVRVAGHMPNRDARVDLMRQAAVLHERELDDPARAFQILRAAWDETGSSELIGELRRLANAMNATDAVTGAAALDQICSGLRSRFEKSWDEQDQMAWLMRIADVQAEDRRDMERAEEAAEEALEIAGRGGVDESARAEVLERLARWQMEAGLRGRATQRVASGLALDPGRSGLIELAGILGVPLPRSTQPYGPGASPEPPGGRMSPAGLQGASLEDRKRDPRPGDDETTLARHTARLEAVGEAEPLRPSDGDPRVSAPVDVPAHAVILAPPEPDADPSPGDETMRASNTLGQASELRERALRDAVRRGSPAAAEELGALLARSQMRSHEGQNLLLWAARRDPARTGALRALHSTARSLDAKALMGVTAEVLSLFDPSFQAPDQHVLTHCATFFDSPVTVIFDAGARPWARVLSLLWRGAMPIYRLNLRDYGLSAGDRASAATQEHLARAFDEARRILAVEEAHLYVRKEPTRELFVARTSPPSLIAGLATGDRVEGLRFRVGRALELTRPEHVLVATLTAEEGDRLINAVGAAFGPAELARDTSLEAARLAANLWHTIPARDQSRMRGILADSMEFPTWDDLRRATMSAGARAGLLLNGGVRSAALALLVDDPDLVELTLDSEPSYAAACHASWSLRELLAFALSDAYLAARTRAMAH